MSCHGTYVVDFSLPIASLPYRRRIVDLFERLTVLMSVSQNLEIERKSNNHIDIHLRQYVVKIIRFISF